MVSPETLAKIERIYADGLNINARLKMTPLHQRAAVARNWLLNDCLELRKIIASGTTYARGVPVVALLKQSQTLLLAARNLRKAGPTVLQ